MRLMIIWGSTRQNRQGGAVANWIARQAEADSRFETDFVDLRDVNLPFYDEPSTAFAIKSLDDYKRPEGRVWAQRVQDADAFIIVTPEYNRGAPGVLKNALDWVGRPWVDKPVAFVSYGGIAGGARVVEHLRPVTIELGLVQVATPLHFPYFEEAFDEKGQPKRLDYYQANFKKMLNEIARLHRLFQ